MDNLTNTTLILGYFDGIHLGHRVVLKNAVTYAKKNNGETVLLTFKSSPSEYFNKINHSIYSRAYNYEIIKSLGVNRIIETDFASIANITADKYIESIIKEYQPVSIFTGFNYTFGYNRVGTPEFISDLQQKYGYEYFCIPAYYYENEIVSSSVIKKYIESGNVEKANTLLASNFAIESIVIEGNHLGAKLGFPTANMEYPENIVKLPYGVYKAEVFNKPAILNWGIKPTIHSDKPIIEVHIPNYHANLYGKKIKVKFIKKIRNEIKFNNLDELKSQIKKDKELCLES